jgi:hypothetical protein
MTSLTFGEIPTDLEISEPFSMQLNARDEAIVVKAINQGIDSHLEAIFATDRGIQGNKHCIAITDSKSMRCLLRRLMETENEQAQDLASLIMWKLEYEWI